MALEPLQALLDGQLRTVEFAGGQVVVDAPRRRRVYLPGSFNPLHDGHRWTLFFRMTRKPAGLASLMQVALPDYTAPSDCTS